MSKTTRKTEQTATLKTVKQVALEDNVSEKTVRRAIAAGPLEVLRTGPRGRLNRIHPAARRLSPPHQG